MITGIVDESGNYESDELKHLSVTSVTWISSLPSLSTPVLYYRIKKNSILRIANDCTIMANLFFKKIFPKNLFY